MSRSYRHNPVLTDGGRNGVRFAKRQANRKVRRAMDIPNGKAYRKVSDSWDIHDYTAQPYSFIEWMAGVEEDYLQYWNGGGSGSYRYRRGNEQRRREIEWEEWQKYKFRPNPKNEIAEYRKMYFWK